MKRLLRGKRVWGSLHFSRKCTRQLQGERLSFSVSYIATNNWVQSTFSLISAHSPVFYPFEFLKWIKNEGPNPLLLPLILYKREKRIYKTTKTTKGSLLCSSVWQKHVVQGGQHVHVMAVVFFLGFFLSFSHCVLW